MEQPFKNRSEAGRVLAQLLRPAAALSLHVFALPRGGVIVAAEVARELNLPLHLLMVRKLGVPRHPEFGFGAIASGGIHYLNEEVVHRLKLSAELIEKVVARETEELRRRESEYGVAESAFPVTGQRIVVIDDGIATGSTMIAALRALRKQNPAELLVATPVAPPGMGETLDREADQVFIAMVPEDFSAVGEWYEDFSQVTDQEVRESLRASGLELMKD